MITGKGETMIVRAVNAIENWEEAVRVKRNHHNK